MGLLFQVHSAVSREAGNWARVCSVSELLTTYRSGVWKAESTEVSTTTAKGDA